MAIVPRTMAQFLWIRGRASCGKNSAKLTQAITINPEITPRIAGIFESLGEIKPKNNKPKSPPLKIEANAHQASKALSTPLKPTATKILKKPILPELQ